MLVEQRDGYTHYLRVLYGCIENREPTSGYGDLIIKPIVKEQLDSMAVAASFYDALSEQVAEIVDDAAQRAEANERTTV